MTYGTLNRPPNVPCDDASEQKSLEPHVNNESDGEALVNSSLFPEQELDALLAQLYDGTPDQLGESYSGKYKDKSWKVYIGDSLEALRLIESGTVDCVVTSPPYFWLRDYGIDRQIGLEDSVQTYVQNMLNVMREVKRVLKSTGILFLNIGDTYYSGKGKSHGKDRKSTKRRFGLRAVDKSGGMGIGLKPKTIIGIPWRVALAMCEDGWILRSPIIWHRQNSLPESVRDRPRRTYENIFMFVKSKRYYFKKESLTRNLEEDMWTISARPEKNSIDTAPFPDELVKRCLDIGCPENGTVLDPFIRRYEYFGYRY